MQVQAVQVTFKGRRRTGMEERSWSDKARTYCMTAEDAKG